MDGQSVSGNGRHAPAEGERGNEVVQILMPLMAAYDPTGAATNKNIEDWYNSAMDRITGQYKRRAQGWLLLIGIVLSVAMNADSLRMFSVLWNDADVRKILVDQAGLAAENGIPRSGNPDSLLQTSDGLRKKLEALPSVLGWEKALVDSMAKAAPDKGALVIGWTKWAGDHPASIIGWLMTAFAVTFGAPFWFDMLNKFINIRNVGKKPKAEPEQKS